MLVVVLVVCSLLRVVVVWHGLLLRCCLLFAVWCSMFVVGCCDRCLLLVVWCVLLMVV